MTLTSANRRALQELVHRYKHGLETSIQMVTSAYDIKVVFEGTSAYTEGRTIYLPNVDVFAINDAVTNEAVEEIRAYFMALKGYAWREAGTIVETDTKVSAAFAKQHGSFASAIRTALEDLRVEARFAKNGIGIAEAMDYTREKWVWARFVRHKARAESVNLFAEAINGLQVMMKHYDTRDEHTIWQCIEPEVRAFVERSSDDLDSAHDTLKMDAKSGTQRLCDVVTHMLARWKTEWEAVSPLLPKKEVAAAKKDAKKQAEWKRDDQAAPDSLNALDESTEGEELANMITSEGIPPLLLVTYGHSVRTLNAVPFANGYVHHVERVPLKKEDWAKLQALTPGETRTLVILPPDPEVERQLNEMMAAFVKGLLQIQSELQEKAEEALKDAQAQIEHLPSDARPYLVYTTENDVYTTTLEGSLRDFNEMKNDVARAVGVVKSRLQVLLRSRTRTKRRNHQKEGHALDPAAMAEIATAKQFPRRELRPYTVQFEDDNLLETVVGLLVDSSGSMGGYAGMGRVSKLQLARQAALCFAEALDQASIKFGLYAFSSQCSTSRQVRSDYVQRLIKEHLSEEEIEKRLDLYGRYGATYIETCKQIGDRWAAVNTRISRLGMVNQANYDADSVHYVVNRLLEHKAKRRVLFVFSDGLPSTGEENVQVARQQRHLRDIVQASMQRGVEIVGIGICDQSVTQYYPRSVVVTDAASLAKATLNEMEFLLLKRR